MRVQNWINNTPDTRSNALYVLALSVHDISVLRLGFRERRIAIESEMGGMFVAQ